MTDERYVFEQDVKEKKRTARGYHNKVRQGGRIKLPSDYLTRKEREQMNSAVVSYQLNSPISFKEFKAMPRDIRAEYLNGLIKRYNATIVWIAEMMGVSQKTLRIYAFEAGVIFPQQSGRKLKKIRPAWDAFLNGERQDEQEINEPEQEPTNDAPEVQGPIKAEIKDTVDTRNIAALLQMLVGTGAKLTIEISL